MLFKQVLAEKILAGDKTQTRRPVKAGDMWRFDDDTNQSMVIGANGRLKIATKRDYAVQYGYGKPCRWWHSKDKVLIPYNLYLKKRGHGDTDADFLSKGWKPMRIRMTNILSENVLNISHADAVAEGFRSSRGFWEVWCGFYDKPALSQMDKCSCPEDWAEWVSKNRPAEKYQAWVYTFELVV